MPQKNIHQHEFVETYDGLVGFGLNRETDEATVKYYLQKFSDDTLMDKLIPLMSDEQLDEVFTLINRLMKSHLSEQDYHRLFLKE